MSDIDIGYRYALTIAYQNSLGKEIIFCLEEEKFYVFEDGYWRIITTTEIMDLIMRSHGDALCGYTIAKRRQIIDNLQIIIYKKLEIFNKNGFLNFPEGEMDMETGYIHNHDKENYSTLRMPYHFRFGAECETWIKTLNEIFENNQDKLNTLQEFFGYCLTRDTKQRKALLLIGESNCGKSTILWTLRNMLGDDNCSDVGVNFIGDPQHTGDMMNKLVNFDTDVSADARSYEEIFKKVAGGEPVRCSPKYITPFTYKPYAKQCYGSNGFPRVADKSDAFYNRLVPIPCERVFEEEEQNKDLPEQLKAELPGIFNWAWEGLKRLNARGRFEIKGFMKEARQDLRDESNPIDVFFRETIEVTKEYDSYIAKPELYNKYLDWCRNNGNSPMSNIKFGKAVFQKYSRITEKDSRLHTGERVWRSLRLKDNTPTPPPTQKDLAWDE